jgi:hypothetical protein
MQLAQATPPLPQSKFISEVKQVLPAPQHPLGHEVALHTQLPPMHS